MRHGGDEIAVLLQRPLLLAGLAQQRQPHLLDARGQLRELVAALRLELQVEIALADGLHLVRDGHDLARHAPVIRQQRQRQHGAAQQQ